MRSQSSFALFPSPEPLSSFEELSSRSCIFHLLFSLLSNILVNVFYTLLLLLGSLVSSPGDQTESLPLAPGPFAGFLLPRDDSFCRVLLFLPSFLPVITSWESHELENYYIWGFLGRPCTSIRPEPGTLFIGLFGSKPFSSFSSPFPLRA